MQSEQYVVFYLNDEEYAIDIAYIQEILRIKKKITKVPNMPSYVEGIIELRGHIIPVVNLCKRFEFDSKEIGNDNKLIIANLNQTMVAFWVDDVSDIVSFEESKMETLNDSICKLGKNSVKGIGRIEERLIILLDAPELNSEIFNLVNKGEKV